MCHKYVVYILKCADGTYYTGSTNCLDRRLSLHQAGKAAKYTRGRRPLSLVFSQSFPTRTKALQAEHRIKKLPRKQKEALIAAGLYALEGDGDAKAKKLSK